MLNILKTKKTVKVKQKSFKINFKGYSAEKICLRPETETFTILGFKRGLLCNFTKALKGRILRDKVAQV